jgi:uncharacterized protein YjbI with pentapeptide repeats
MAQSSISGANHSTASHPPGGPGSASGGSANKANMNSANANKGNFNSSNVNSANVNKSNYNSANVNKSNYSSANVNSANINKVNVNTTNVNNVNVNGGYNNAYYHGGSAYYHPVATGMVIGAVAVTTAAVVGSYYRALPPSGCTMVNKNGAVYQYCGSVYYQQTYSGNDVVYVVVNP